MAKEKGAKVGQFESQLDETSIVRRKKWKFSFFATGLKKKKSISISSIPTPRVCFRGGPLPRLAVSHRAEQDAYKRIHAQDSRRNAIWKLESRSRCRRARAGSSSKSSSRRRPLLPTRKNSGNATPRTSSPTTHPPPTLTTTTTTRSSQSSTSSSASLCLWPTSPCSASRSSARRGATSSSGRTATSGRRG